MLKVVAGAWRMKWPQDHLVDVMLLRSRTFSFLVDDVMERVACAERTGWICCIWPHALTLLLLNLLD